MDTGNQTELGFPHARSHVGAPAGPESGCPLSPQGVRMGETSTNIATLNMDDALKVRVKDGCDVEDPCASSPCPQHSRCLDAWDSYTCVCDKGGAAAPAPPSLRLSVGVAPEVSKTHRAKLSGASASPPALVGAGSPWPWAPSSRSAPRPCPFSVDASETPGLLPQEGGRNHARFKKSTFRVRPCTPSCRSRSQLAPVTLVCRGGRHPLPRGSRPHGGPSTSRGALVTPFQG